MRISPDKILPTQFVFIIVIITTINGNTSPTAVCGCVSLCTF